MPVVVRPSFLLVEPNPEEALSSRKLVVESAKFNILTAHSEPEAIQQFEKFPLVDAVILHTRLEGYDRVASHVKQQNGSMPLILLQAFSGHDAIGADHVLSSHSPQDLVELLRSKFGDPRV